MRDPSYSANHYGLIGLFFVFMTISLVVFALAPRDDGDKVVVFVSPFAQETLAVQVIANAKGSLVGTAKPDWFAFGISDDPNFVKKLYAAGALFVGSAEAFSACLPSDLLTTEMIERSVAPSPPAPSRLDLRNLRS